jgi:hypothetical protein
VSKPTCKESLIPLHGLVFVCVSAFATVPKLFIKMRLLTERVLIYFIFP